MRMRGAYQRLKRGGPPSPGGRERAWERGESFLPLDEIPEVLAAPDLDRGGPAAGGRRAQHADLREAERAGRRDDQVQLRAAGPHRRHGGLLAERAPGVAELDLEDVIQMHPRETDLPPPDRAD